MSSPTATTLAATGNQLEIRFKASFGEPRSPEFKAVVNELRVWLEQCVAQGRFLPSGSPERRSLQGQVDYWTSRLRQEGLDFDEIDRIAPFDIKAGRVLADDQFPYHGLLAATGTAGKVFAGRDEQIKEYADHIDEQPALLIQSESGGGKSSVAMAGVLPELQRRHPDWRVLLRVTPGTNPLENLREALASLLSLSTVDARTVQAALRNDETLLVYVDQLEELLTMCRDVQQQEAFSDLLAALADAGVLRLVATMRVDHYERLARSAACHRLFVLLTRNGSVKTLPPMNLAQIRSVILKPADAVGLRFVPASIVETLASECAATPSGLPLLQFALQRLWEERPREGSRPDGPRLDMITLDTMSKLPSVSEALSKVAHDYLVKMEAQGLVGACQRLMLELTVIDERLEVPLRRRRAEREVLDLLVNTGLAQPEQALVLVNGLIERRLLVRTGEGDARQIEVAHEALFRHWDQFQKWINDDGVRARLRDTQSINREALLWDQSGRKSDYLKLIGEVLARAVQHRQAHWLDPLAAAYVQACEQSENEAAQRRAEEQASAARAKADADAARAQALKARARVRRLSQGVTLICLALFALIALDQNRRHKEVELRRKEVELRRQELELRSTTALAYVLPQLPPLDSLDLAYTLHKKRDTPESRASLAHAIAQIGDVILVGKRDSGPASFTFSGQAAMQLISVVEEKIRKVDHVLVRVMGPQLEDLAPAVKVPLELKDDEVLAAFDVGPPMAKDDRQGVADGDRLAVASVLGSDGAQGKILRSMRIFRVGKEAEATRVAEVPYPDKPRPTSSASEIAFDPGGRGLAVLARLRVTAGLSGEQTATRIVQWTLGETAKTDQMKNAGEAITTLAFNNSSNPALNMGRIDGRVDCAAGGDTILNLDGQSYKKRPHRVVALKFADATQFASVHEDNSVSVGDCATQRIRTTRIQGPGTPEQLTVWPIVSGDNQQKKEHRLAVSYSLKGRLVCQTFNLDSVRDGAILEDGRCPGHGQVARSAVPAFDAQGELVGYRVLDSTAPSMTIIKSRFDAASTQEDVARGAPVATLLPDTPGQSVAMSANGMHQIKIVRQEGKDEMTEVTRVGGSAHTSPAMKNIKDPQWAAVNDQGATVVLTSRRLEPRHQLSLFGPDDQLLGGSVPTFADAACLKLSPDGSQAIVASDWGKVKRYTMGAPPATDPAESREFADSLRDAVTACATGNGSSSDAVVVVATQSGQVRRYDAKAGKWLQMSELRPFQLAGPALDVSIDGSSRFVAVVSSGRVGACRNGTDGHLVRIWDLKLRLPEYPVASACINFPLQSIGPLRTLENNGGWVLPIYQQLTATDAGDVVPRSQFPCLACDVATSTKAMNDGIKLKAEGLGALTVPDDTLRDVYGIAP